MIASTCHRIAGASPQAEQSQPEFPQQFVNGYHAGDGGLDDYGFLAVEPEDMARTSTRHCRKRALPARAGERTGLGYRSRMTAPAPC